MHLRRTRVNCLSFAACAPPLTHVCTFGACGKKSRRGPPAALLGEGVWRHVWGDGARCPSGRHGAKYRSLYRHVGFKSFSKISNFCGLGCSRKAVAGDHQSPTPLNSTILHSAQKRFLLDPPCSVASFEENSEPHTGAHPSVRLCVGLIITLGLKFSNAHKFGPPMAHEI